MKYSLSGKIAFLFTVFTVVIVIFFSTVMVALIRHSLQVKKENEILQSIHTITVQLQKGEWDFSLPFYVLYTVFDTEKNILATNDPFIPLLKKTEPGKTKRFFEKQYFIDDDLNVLYAQSELLLTVNENTSKVYIQTALDMSQDTTDAFIASLPVFFVLCGIPLLCISWISAKLITARMLLPIQKITQEASDISSANLHLRLDETGAKDELAELSHTFNQLFARLENDFKRQQRFTSDVSHELKTPLAVILGYTDLLRRWGKNDSAVLDEAISALYDEGQSMKKLIDDLLFLSRTELPAVQYYTECINVKPLLEKIRNDIIVLCANVQVQLCCEDNARIYTNESALKQIIRILCDNALLYSTAPAYIYICFEDCKIGTEKQAHFIVADKGHGIPEESLPHIFDRFYRADESRNRLSGGSGLGLAIAQSLSHTLGALIRVESGKDIPIMYFKNIQDCSTETFSTVFYITFR